MTSIYTHGLHCFTDWYTIGRNLVPRNNILLGHDMSQRKLRNFVFKQEWTVQIYTTCKLCTEFPSIQYLKKYILLLNISYIYDFFLQERKGSSLSFCMCKNLYLFVPILCYIWDIIFYLCDILVRSSDQ